MKFRLFSSIVSASVALIVVASGPAFAHASLTGTFPSDGESISTVDAVSLNANEDLLDLGGGAGFVFSVTDSRGHFYGDGCVLVDGPTASMPVQLGEGGEYSVAYRVVSADGHPIEGGWTFTYVPPENAELGEALRELPVCGEPTVPVNTPEPTTEPEPSPTATAETAGEFDVIPFIGFTTIPLVLGAIWLLMRSLGKHDSEDHLN